MIRQFRCIAYAPISKGQRVTFAGYIGGEYPLLVAPADEGFGTAQIAATAKGQPVFVLADDDEIQRWMKTIGRRKP